MPIKKKTLVARQWLIHVSPPVEILLSCDIALLVYMYMYGGLLQPYPCTVCLLIGNFRRPQFPSVPISGPVVAHVLAQGADWLQKGICGVGMALLLRVAAILIVLCGTCPQSTVQFNYW